MSDPEACPLYLGEQGFVEAVEAALSICCFPSLRGSSRQAAAVGGWGLGEAGVVLGKKHGKLAEEEGGGEREVAEWGLAWVSPCKKLKRTDRQTDRQTRQTDLSQWFRV
jgi:hypothetical protein